MSKIGEPCISTMLSKSAQKYGQKTFFVSDNFSKSYNEFYDDVNKVSTYLIDNNLHNKKIGIYASNSYYWLLIFFAVSAHVGTIVPLDKELPGRELLASVGRVDLDLVFYDDSTKDIVGRLANNTKIEHIKKLDNILDKATNNDADWPVKHQCAALFLTSGTTSGSKIVMLSEKNLVSCAYAAAAAFKIKPTDRYYTILPLHHTLTLMCAVLVPITNGCSICFSKNIKNMQKELKFYRPTALVVVPRLLEYMMDNIKRAVKKMHRERFLRQLVSISKVFSMLHIDIRRLLFAGIHNQFGGKVRMIACGGAELDERVFSYLDDIGFNIYQGYGLTESSPILTIRGMHVRSKIGVGKPLKGVQLRIDKPDANGIGEIVAKAPQIMLGYYRDKKATKEIVKEGWLYTGDLGKIRSDGNLEVVGRKKNVIIASNGKNIYPEELETLINYSSVVKESVVSGIFKNANLQLVATIVPEAESQRDKKLDRKIKQLIEEINAELPAYKHINKYIVKVDEFEKTTTLKIKRSES